MKGREMTPWAGGRNIAKKSHAWKREWIAPLSQALRTIWGKRIEINRFFCL
jgi:hypothetical protein